jgi:hypothetical protein
MVGVSTALTVGIVRSVEGWKGIDFVISQVTQLLVSHHNVRQQEEVSPCNRRTADGGQRWQIQFPISRYQETSLYSPPQG